MNINLVCHTQKALADQITPIGIYLNLRELFPASILLESSEIEDKMNARSILCANPIGGIQLTAEKLTWHFKHQNWEKKTHEITRIQDDLKQFFGSFHISNPTDGINGFFGFQTFEAVRYFETAKANLCEQASTDSPILDYRLYQYVVCFNHFNDEITFIENTLPDAPNTLPTFINSVFTKRSSTYPFKLTSEETCTSTDSEFLANIIQAQAHCKRGDVFQMVLSRRFNRNYQGDEFNVYRALRHINPSPYMFYFDYGGYKIFGSSPEAQIRIVGKEASINPIAGTYKRTGDKEQDRKLAEALLQDQKEIAEHAMLVDLARNDMNRHAGKVHVSAYKTIQQYSHVIHIVSTVKGELKDKTENIEVLADTFPAGTLSGAPKVRAIQILSALEKHPRGFYGGSIGFIDFNGDIHQAIVIRSFMARNQTLHYQAGAGVVLKSNPESELQEVHNKLGALRKALALSEKL
jgi:anthranilate synthase component 1